MKPKKEEPEETPKLRKAVTKRPTQRDPSKPEAKGKDGGKRSGWCRNCDKLSLTKVEKAPETGLFSLEHEVTHGRPDHHPERRAAIGKIKHREVVRRRPNGVWINLGVDVYEQATPARYRLNGLWPGASVRY